MEYCLPFLGLGSPDVVVHKGKKKFPCLRLCDRSRDLALKTFADPRSNPSLPSTGALLRITEMDFGDGQVSGLEQGVR